LFTEPNVTQYCGNAMEVLNGLQPEIAQMAVTSPPYWGLRKYSGEQEMIWGDGHCEHDWAGQGVISDVRKDTITAGKSRTEERYYGDDPTRKFNGQHQKHYQDNTCLKCGAWRGAFGLEPTPEMYVEHTVEFLRAIRRVLRKDGVCFWNIGDSYGSGKGTCFNPGGGKGSFSGHGDRKDAGPYPLDRGNISMLKASGLKPKDLCLIPFRVALAAQADGWWVRSIIIWSKNNPMPESCRDRPTESHEYILMLTKSSKYYWDIDAVREPMTPLSIGNVGDLRRGVSPSSHAPIDAPHQLGGKTAGDPTMGRNIRSVWTMNTEPFGLEMCLKCKTIYDSGDYQRLSKREVPAPSDDDPDATQHQIWCTGCRDWTNSPQDWLSHFAVFPTELPRRCILAATSEKGNCSKCGKPWVRVTEGQGSQFNIRVRDAKAGRATPEEGYKATELEMEGYPGNHPDPGYRNTVGWQAQCKCNAEIEPPIVLDPFSGVGTTGMVAKQLGRRAILIDTSEDYCRMAQRRIEKLPIPML